VPAHPKPKKKKKKKRGKGRNTSASSLFGKEGRKKRNSILGVPKEKEKEG